MPLQALLPLLRACSLSASCKKSRLGRPREVLCSPSLTPLGKENQHQKRCRKRKGRRKGFSKGVRCTGSPRQTTPCQQRASASTHCSCCLSKAPTGPPYSSSCAEVLQPVAATPLCHTFDVGSKRYPPLANMPNANVDSFPGLFESESGSDVTLLVGEAAVQERIPAHSWILAHNNDYFRSLLLGPSRDLTNTEFYFPDDRPKAFRSLIRWLYRGGCCPRDVQSALDVLQIAIKYLCVDLVVHVVQFLSKSLNPDNVLHIMTWGHQYTSNKDSSRFAPSAPPAGVDDDLPPPYPGTGPPPYESIVYDSDHDPTDSCSHLVQECLMLLDARAEAVLASESLEDVSDTLLSVILSRDSLSVSSEATIVDALCRWSSAECRRHHEPLTLDGRRKVIGNLFLVPRLLRLPAEELQVLQKLYYPNEISYIAAAVRKEPCRPPAPPSLKDYLELMARPRQVSLASVSGGKTKNKASGGGKKKYSVKQLMWDVFSVFAHMID